MKHLFLIALLLIAFPAQAADSYAGKDKLQHKILFAGLTEAGYIAYRYNDVEYSAEKAAATAFAIGIAKEVLFDPSPLNKYPTKPSGKDIVANAAGIGAAYGLIKAGELCEDKYDFNPFYWRW